MKKILLLSILMFSTGCADDYLDKLNELHDFVDGQTIRLEFILSNPNLSEKDKDFFYGKILAYMEIDGLIHRIMVKD